MFARVFPRGPLWIPRLPEPPRLEFRVPGSKSITNRALILAALAPGTSRLEGVLHSDDTHHMRAGLEALGIGIEDAPGAAAGADANPDLPPPGLIVHGGRARLRPPAAPIFVGNSGTTVRFLTALAALVDGPVTLVGDAAMARRPLSDLVDGLAQLGIRVDCPTGAPPLTVHGDGGRFNEPRVRMRGDRSSQYFSALLMAAGLADQDITLAVEGPLVSRPYVDITTRMIADFGGAVEVEAGAGGTLAFHVRPTRAGYRPRGYTIEPDASSASYPFALAAASGGRITVPGLAPGALQGDYAFVDVLARMGARISAADGTTTVEGTAPLRGVEVDMHDISDTVMTLAAIAPLAAGTTTIRNVANIRIKETDRLAATVAELRRLGQLVRHGDDWLSIEPAPRSPAVIECYSDHRMAMSFAVLGAADGGVGIADPSCVSKTYPGFWRALAACYPAGPARPSWS
jgi:3-phosphoshikimate 1-carboxyvinyltransferase